jgi:lysophospholipase L1-like esterase
LFVNYGPQDTEGPIAITFGCAIEIGTDQSTSAKYPLTFAGRLTTTLDPGGHIWSDPISLDLVAGAVIFPRTYATVASLGYGFRATYVANLALGEGNDTSDTSPIDKRLSGTITLKDSSYSWGPVASKGLSAATPLPIMGHTGDSIISGTGETGAAGFYRAGWAYRGLAGRLPLVHVTGPGSSALDTKLRVRGRTHLTLCDNVITAFGTNDLGQSSDTTKANFIALWRSIRSMGPRVWHPTIPPNSTSSDGWASVVNQTTSIHNSKRIEENNWLRDGAPLNPTTFVAEAIGTGGSTIRAGSEGHPLSGYLELADLLESARDSGFWKAGYTADGIHPNPTGHIAGSAVLADLSRFGYTG